MSNNNGHAVNGSMPTPYQDFIHISRYARWLESEKRRETWSETVTRYVDFMCDKQCEGRIPPELKKEIWEAIHGLEVMPSMRALMTAGPALERDHVAGYNCLAGDTLVTTLEHGIVPISELAGKSVHVVDGEGNWVKSPCRSFGRRNLTNVHLASSGVGSDFVLKSTEDHDWILRDGTKKKTSELCPGERLAFVGQPAIEKVDPTSDDYLAGVEHGIVFGDGAASFCTRKEKKFCKGFVIRLCSDAEDLLPYFSRRNVSYPKSFDGDPVVYLYGKDQAIDLKDFPDVESGFFTHDYLVGFMRGWFAADGSVSVGHQVTLATGKEGLFWVYRYGPSLGFVPRGHNKYPSSTNYGDRVEDLYRIEIDRRWMESDDVIIERKRKNFKKVDFSKNPGFGKISSIERTDVEEEVFCFDVPTTHSFLLTRNILTGNCAYVAIDHPYAFDETLYVLMCGTGVGFSVERQFIAQLPQVAETLRKSNSTIVVEDSKIGWANAYRELIGFLYGGRIPKWDVSKVRGAGVRLETFGGRASGPGPLEDLFKFTIGKFQDAVGRKLNSIECHDIMCKVGEIVVVGGVRRSALISLSNPSDDRMRAAKSGEWWNNDPQRALANNSACYTEKPGMDTFMKEWMALYQSKSGERGIFNRVAAAKQAEKYGRRDSDVPYGCNPCSEIILRSCQFCNLSEVVVREYDDEESLKRKVRIATILGTIQATLTNFRYLRSVWAENCREESLLGVSLTGILDNHFMAGLEDRDELAGRLDRLRAYAVEVNREWAENFGINPSAAITCVKPSGTVSQLVNAASGIHPRFSHHYIRTVRADKKDPLGQMMTDLGFPVEDDVSKPEHNLVFSFPVSSPENSLISDDFRAIEQLELWKLYQENWCEHKPSMTVYVRESEWMSVGAWVYENFDSLSGVSFLPYSGHTYRQAPYQEITKEEFETHDAMMPKDVDWSRLREYETEDHTIGSKEYACASDSGECEIVDLTASE